MKRFFTKTGIWLLGGAAVIAVVLCIISALGSGTSLLHNALGVIASPFRSAGAAVVAWVDGIGDHFASIEDLQAETKRCGRIMPSCGRHCGRQRPPPRRTSGFVSCWTCVPSAMI